MHHPGSIELRHWPFWNSLFRCSSRGNARFLSPATCPSSPWTSGPANGFGTSSSSNDLNHNGDAYSHSTSFNFNNKLLTDDTNIDQSMHLSPDDLYSSTKEGKTWHRTKTELLFELFFLDLVKMVLALQHHSSKITHMDQIHSNAVKRLEMQSMQQQHAIDRESP